MGALLFVAYYSVFLLGLERTSPGYIARVWNLDALSGLDVLGMPLEELLFAAAFGAYWSGVYDHANHKVHEAERRPIWLADERGVCDRPAPHRDAG